MIALLLLAAQDVENDSPRFRFPLPSGYVFHAAKEASRFYVREDAPGRRVLTVTLLTGAVQPGEIAKRRAELAEELGRESPGATMSEVGHTAWKGRTIEVLDFRRAPNLFGTMAFIPTGSTGTRIEVLGPSSLEPEIRGDLLRVLAGFEARTWWLLPGQERFMKSLPWLAMAPIVAAALYGAAWGVFFRRRPWRLFWLRTGGMLAMGLLALAPPWLWELWMDDLMIPPPGVCTWPLPLFLAAPWLMLASVRGVGYFMRSREQAA